MAGFNDRLSQIKATQEAKNSAETARLEREAERSELIAQRDGVREERIQTEQTANEAREAIAQADAFVAEQGEKLDPEVRAQIDALKAEAEEAQRKFEELKAKEEALSQEIAAFEESAAGEEAPVESNPEKSEEVEETAEAQTEAEMDPQERQQRIETLKAELTTREELQEITQKCQEEAVQRNSEHSERERRYTEQNIGRTIFAEELARLPQPDYRVAKELAQKVEAKAAELGIDGKKYTSNLVNQGKSVGGLANLLWENRIRMGEITRELKSLET